MLFCIFRGRLEKTHVPRLWRFALVLFLVVRDFLFCSSSALTFKDKRSDGTSRRTAQSQGRGSKRRKICNDFRGFRGHDFRGHFTGPDCSLVALFCSDRPVALFSENLQKKHYKTPARMRFVKLCKKIT